MTQSINPKEIASRIAEARKARGLTQEEAAEKFGCKRLTMIHIEKGKRPLKPEEIVRLAQIYGRTVHELVRPSGSEENVVPIPTDFDEEAKRNGVSTKDYEQAYACCKRFLDDYSELETVSNTTLRVNFPPSLSFSRQRHSESLAETIATQERDRLGLADKPTENLRHLLEWEVGLRSYYGELPDSMAGIVFFSQDKGGIVIANRQQSREQCLWTLVYCYGHLLRDRFQARIAYVKQEGNRSAEERFAEKFAESFLMPISGIRRHFYTVIESTNDFNLLDLFRMARLFHVPVDKLAHQLVELRLIDKEMSIRIEQKQGRIQGPLSGVKNNDFTERYVSLAVRAFHEDKVSIGQLAQFLRTDEVGARGIAQEVTTFNDDALFVGISKQSSPFFSLVK